MGNEISRPFEAPKAEDIAPGQDLVLGGANENANYDTDKNTTLVSAAETGRLDVVRYLVEQGVDKEAKNKDSQTALILAAYKGHVEIVRYLVDNGANVDAKGKDDETALVLATWQGHLEIVQYLVEHRADIEAKPNNDNAALIWAAWDDHLEIAKYLIDKGADKDTRGYIGNTPLIVAAERGFLKMVQYLVGQGVNKEFKRNEGNTALLMAAQNGHLAVVRYLAESGADTTCLNNDNYSALALLLTRNDANESRLFPIAKSLLEHGTHSLESNQQVKSIATAKGYIRIAALVEPDLSPTTNPSWFISPTTNPSWFISPDAVDKIDDKLLGEGSFGTVYRAKWAYSDVVVKEILVVEMRRFLKEVDTWRKLTHNNVVPFYGANHRYEPYFIVSKYASNGTLIRFLEREKKEGRTVVWQKLRDVAAGLSYLHQQNIVHGDLRGDNIVVSDNGTAMLTDFGLSFTESGSCYMKKLKDELGAMQWRAPELANLTLKTPTCSSDVYSLGMCIIEAVTGKIPWGTKMDHPDMIRELLRANDVKAHLQKPGEMTDSQWELVNRMIETDPKHRPDMDYVLSKLNGFAEVKINDDGPLLNGCSSSPVGKLDGQVGRADVTTKKLYRCLSY